MIMYITDTSLYHYTTYQARAVWPCPCPPMAQRDVLWEALPRAHGAHRDGEGGTERPGARRLSSVASEPVLAMAKVEACRDRGEVRIERMNEAGEARRRV